MTMHTNRMISVNFALFLDRTMQNVLFQAKFIFNIRIKKKYFCHKECLFPKVSKKEFAFSQRENLLIIRSKLNAIESHFNYLFLVRTEKPSALLLWVLKIIVRDQLGWCWLWRRIFFCSAPKHLCDWIQWVTTDCTNNKFRCVSIVITAKMFYLNCSWIRVQFAPTLNRENTTRY